MRKVFLLITLILIVVLFASIGWGDGWVNAEQEIQKSVQSNSPKPPAIEFIDLVSSMTNVQNVISQQTKGGKITPKGCGCEENEPYVMINFWNAQKIKDVLEGKEKLWKYFLDDNKFHGIAVYSGENLNNFFACPDPMDMGTYTITDAGTHDFTLSFMSITTNASIIVKIQDGGWLTNASSANEKMPAWHGFVSLNASITSLLCSLSKNKITKEDVERILFRKPTTFHRAYANSPASFEIANSSHSVKISLWSWWLRTRAFYDTPAGIYKDEVKITVFADVKDW
jgi:hypothetical protein